MRRKSTPAPWLSSTYRVSKHVNLPHWIVINPRRVWANSLVQTIYFNNFHIITHYQISMSFLSSLNWWTIFLVAITKPRVIKLKFVILFELLFTQVRKTKLQLKISWKWLLDSLKDRAKECFLGNVFLTAKAGFALTKGLAVYHAFSKVKDFSFRKLLFSARLMYYDLWSR